MPEDTQRVSDLADLLMEDAWEASSPPPGPCPDADTIGALIEGTLPAEERERVEEHIAACERCYEGYATAMAFLAEEGREEAAAPVHEATVTPFRPTPADPGAGGSASAPEKLPRPASGPGLRWLSLAAALAVISASGYWFVHSRALPSQATLLAELKGNPAVAGQLWNTNNLRGNPEIPEDLGTTQELLQEGALSFDLRLAIEHGKATLAGDYADNLSSVLDLRASPKASNLAKRLKGLADGLKAEGARTKAFEREAAALTREVEEMDSDRPAYAFGALLEASRIAAGLGDARLLQPERLLRALDRWQKEGRVDEDSEEDFAELRRTLKVRPLDLPAVREAIAHLEAAYTFEIVDPSQLDDLDLDAPSDSLPPTPPQPEK